MDTDLELVRKGYDPAQVQDLVGKLSNELKALTAENDQLRAQVSELQQAPPSPTAADPQPDVFDHWSNETNSLFAAARESIAAVHAKAESDAAAVVAATETEMQALLERTTAQVEAAKVQLADLVQQRADISKQLGSTKAQLTQLLSLVAAPDDAPANDAPANDAPANDATPNDTTPNDTPDASAEHADDHA